MTPVNTGWKEIGAGLRVRYVNNALEIQHTSIGQSIMIYPSEFYELAKFANGHRTSAWRSQQELEFEGLENAGNKTK